MKGAEPTDGSKVRRLKYISALQTTIPQNGKNFSGDKKPHFAGMFPAYEAYNPQAYIR